MCLLRVDTAARIWKRLSGAWLMKNERSSRFSRAATNAFRSLFTPIRDTLLRSKPIVSFHCSLLVRGAEEEVERERMWRRIIECFRDAISYANAACLARFVAYFYLPLR